MGWENIRINEVEVDAKPQPVPNGTYTLQLLGAAESKFQDGGLNLTTAIADEGEYAGRRIFVDVPSPDRQPWAVQVLKRLLDAMGATMADGADPVAELNRIAQNGHSRFTADVFTEEFTRNDGTAGKKNKVAYRSFRAAA